jgi:monoamine oxidase
MRIAVVGAGFAGLACAADLTRGGADVTVFEARSRVGGRAWSDLIAGGQRFERGGEFIEAGYHHLRRRAAEHGLELSDQGFAFAAREVRDGGRAEPALLLDAEQTMASTVRALGAEAGRASAAEALERSSLGPLARRALVRRLEGTYTLDLDRVSAAWLSSVELRGGLGDAQPSARLAAGNDSLARALAAPLGERLRLSCAVGELRDEGDGVRILADGVSERYDQAVLTVPLPLALTLLPVLRARASYARLGFGVASKLHIPLAEPAPPAAVQGLDAAFWVWTASGIGGSPATVAASFAGGADAHAALEIGQGAERWRAALQSLRPELDLADDAVLTSWGEDPYSLGSYACHPPGWSRRDDEAMAVPCGRVHLAGEHTAAEFCGTMEGALRSGARAAAELLTA